jgi:hypothetical protein
MASTVQSLANHEKCNIFVFTYDSQEKFQQTYIKSWVNKH